MDLSNENMIHIKNDKIEYLLCILQHTSHNDSTFLFKNPHFYRMI